jgi:hypothetical protein
MVGGKGLQKGRMGKGRRETASGEVRRQGKDIIKYYV